MLRPGIFEKDFFDAFMTDFAQPTKARYIDKTMRTDIEEFENEYKLSVELPGYKKEDIKMELRDGYLNISAKIENEKEETDEKKKVIHKERYYGTCSRKYFVGHDVKQEDVKAKFEDGILKVVIPKVTEKEVKENYIVIE